MHISFTQLQNHAHEVKFDSMFHASKIGLGRYAQVRNVIGFSSTSIKTAIINLILDEHTV